MAFLAASGVRVEDRAAIARDDVRAQRARPDSWLVGAFLVLFGVAVSAAMPQIAGAVRLAIANSSKTGGTADTAQRPSIRLHILAVKAVEPKLSGGQDVSYPLASAWIFAPSRNRISLQPVDLAARIQQRGFSARAPPAHVA